MSLNLTTSVLAYIALMALQILIPAFTTMTEAQHTAIAAFCQVAGSALGIGALYRNPNGTPAQDKWEKK